MFTGLTSKSSTSSAGNSKSGALREPDDFPPYELTSAGNPFMLSDDRLYPPMRGHSISYDHIPLRQTLSTSPRHRADSFASGDGDSSLLETSPHLQYRGEYASDTHPIHTSRGVHVTHQDIASPPFTQVRRYATPIETSVLVSSYPPEPNSATTATSSSHDGDSEAGTLAAKGNAQPPPRQRKNRREKPHIELAPDQPPTTQGKPRCRVYVACAQCRNRKIRCDGAKPVCHNCSRRTASNSAGECSYDANPKRRGPDKTPGARQRMARELRNDIDSDLPQHRRRRRRAVSSTPTRTDTWDVLPSPLSLVMNQTTAAVSSPVYLVSSSSSNPVEDYLLAPNPIDGECRSSSYPDELTGPLSQISYDNADGLNALTTVSSSRSYDNVEEDCGEVVSHDIGAEPSIDFTRKIWWDSLLSLYCSSPSSSSRQFITLTASQREATVQNITSDLRFLFRVSNYWFQFFHVPSFFRNYLDSAQREQLQPSLILAALALSTFWQSSETGNGRLGRERALCFRDEAQGTMEASFNAGWIDETLAQAAWLLALFEICAHPLHSTQRSASSMLMLDSIIRSLSLTFIDADDPHTTKFTSRTVPIITPEQPQREISQSTLNHSNSYHSVTPPLLAPNLDGSTHSTTTSGCSCISLTLGRNSRASKEHTPMWEATPAWNDSWSEAETRKESCRRLCWSAMVLAAGHINYTIVTATSRSTGLDLFVADPANYAIFFSGESITRSHSLRPPHSPKDTIWALYDRAFLLWHGCMRMRHDPTATDTEKAHFGVNAWLEADALEHALNQHTCGLERMFIFQGREYLFNTRMCISYEFQRFIPLATTNVSGLFNRRKAEEWLTHQATVATRFVNGLHTITGMANSVLARRPFFVFWFMAQISRALALWACDNTMIVALHVCRAFLGPIDYLTALWPCQEQRLRYERLRERLSAACYVAGLPPLPPKPTPSGASTDNI